MAWLLSLITLICAICSVSPPYVMVPSSEAPVSGSRYSYREHPATAQAMARRASRISQVSKIWSQEAGRGAMRLIERRAVVVRGGDCCTPWLQTDIRADLTHAPIAHHGLHGIRAVERVNRVEVLLVAG